MTLRFLLQQEPDQHLFTVARTWTCLETALDSTTKKEALVRFHGNRSDSWLVFILEEETIWMQSFSVSLITSSVTSCTDSVSNQTHPPRPEPTRRTLGHDST